MTQEEKELLLKDLCARLPYGVKGKLRDSNYTAILKDIRYSCFYPLFVCPLEYHLTNYECSIDVDEFKPYLRPLSSITDEEEEEYWNIINLKSPEMPVGEIPSIETISQCSIIVLDWLLSKGFDIRGLIPMGLALEATEDIYKTK